MSKQAHDENQHYKYQDNEADNRPNLGLPQPPPYHPKLRIAPLQLIGIPLLALLPILALFGVFGEGMTTTRATNDEAAASVIYVSRYRYGMQDSMSVSVTNLSLLAPMTATVIFEQSYIEHFSNVSFMPSVEQVSTEGYLVQLDDIPSMQTRFVKLEMQGEQYWTKSGIITISLSSGQPLTVEVSTTIFP